MNNASPTKTNWPGSPIPVKSGSVTSDSMVRRKHILIVAGYFLTSKRLNGSSEKEWDNDNIQK